MSSILGPQMVSGARGGVSTAVAASLRDVEDWIRLMFEWM